MTTRPASEESSQGPTITVAICTFNRADSLAQTLETLEQQLAPPDLGWEVLVVDNNSTDQTREVVADFRRRGRIPLLRSVAEPLQGTGHARCRALLESRARFLAYTDDDCLVDPNWVQAAVEAIDSRPAAGGVGGRIELDWPLPLPQEVTALATMAELGATFGEVDLGPDPADLTADFQPRIITGNAVFRRRALLESGWAENRLLSGRQGRTGRAAWPSGEDSEMVFFVRRAGYEMWYDPALRVTHAVSPDRFTRRHILRLQRGFGEASAVLHAFGHNEAATFPWRLRWFYRSANRLVRILASWAVRKGQGRSTEGQRLRLAFTTGQVRGGWRALFLSRMAEVTAPQSS